MKLELCIDSFGEAVIAHHYHLDRVELCAALEVGGLTPSAGLIQRCSSMAGIETHVMIRPRSGGFVYSADELKIMQNDIQMAAELGVNGVVFGILDNSNQINTAANRILVSLAKKYNLEATFHRAFDLVKDPNQSLKTIIDLGFDRLLTSGQKEKAIEGIGLIEQLLDEAKGNIQIMPGSGIDSSNARQFKSLGVDALHFTARKTGINSTLAFGEEHIPNRDKIEGILAEVRP